MTRLAQLNLLVLNFCFIPEIRCSPLELNERVTRRCTDGNNHGSECSFSCDTGYNLEGAQKTECGGKTSPGTWSNPSPECRRKLQNFKLSS